MDNVSYPGTVSSKTRGINVGRTYNIRGGHGDMKYPAFLAVNARVADVEVK